MNLSPKSAANPLPAASNSAAGQFGVFGFKLLIHSAFWCFEKVFGVLKSIFSLPDGENAAGPAVASGAVLPAETL
jgi:hypothetical protein